MEGDMRSTMNSFVTITAAASIGALAVTPLAIPPPPSVPEAPQAANVALAADSASLDSVPIGALPVAFVRNQLIFCSLICPSVVQLVTTVPIGVAQAPVAFVGGLQTGSLLRAVGAAAESVTGPADIATTGIINPDVFIVVPKAVGVTLPIVVVQAFNIGHALGRPGELVPTIETAREKILEALNTPAVPFTPLPSGAQGLAEVATVAGVNVFDAVAFRAGELLISGAVHTANVTATELANTGNARDALAAGAAAANEVGGVARGIVTAAVDKAASDIRGALPERPAVTARPAVSAVSTRTATPPASGRVGAGPVAAVAKSAVHNLNRAVHDITKRRGNVGRHRA
jgi:hypothetical protein